jgi:membrane protease YdiL (CAAX protease family)
MSSAAFSLWHLSWVTLTEDGRLPIAQVPVYLLNAAVIGLIWGMLRLASGSVIVASLSHGVWNGLTYSLFGFGTHAGALGIRDINIYGPEVGVLGLALNVVCAFLLWVRITRER